MRRAVWFGLLASAVLGVGFIAMSHARVKKVPDWTPPKTTVAKELVDTGQFLLKHGFGDPRGGKLGLATVSLSGSWSQQAQDVQVLGWIKDDGTKKTIVDMAGITFPVKSVVELFKTEDAVNNALKLEESGKVHYTGPINRLMPFFVGGTGSDDTKFHELLSDQAVIELLIHGDTGLAEKLFAKRSHPEYEGNKPVQKPGIDKYTEYSLLNSFLSAYWIAAVNAHMRGDDDLAYLMGKTLADNADDYEKFGATLQTGRVFMPDENTGKKTMFAFILPADQLAKDAKRRIKEGPKTVDMASLDKLSSKDRVAKLIEWLDQVSARQWGQPGGVNLADDKIVQALIKEGNAAGDALLDCMEKDTRLTRSVSFGRDFFPGRNLLTVKSAAFAAFCGITQIDAYGPNMRRQPTVADLREMWAKNKNLIPAERWFNVLKDDKSSHQQWVAAAAWLTEPKDVVHSGGGWVTVPKTNNGKPISPAKFTDLPAAKKTELPDVLEARSRLIEKQNTEQSSLKLYEHEMALDIAVALFSVDKKRTIPLLSELVQLAVNDPINNHGGGIAYNMGNAVVRACGCLIEANQPNAEKVYVQFIKSQEADTFGNARSLIPLMKMDPAKADAYVKDILTAKGSTHNVEENIAKGKLFHVRSLMESPMLLYPSFRNILIGLLSRKEVVGKVEIREDSKSVSVRGSSGWQTGAPVPDPAELAGASKAECRLGDFFAMQLSNRKGAPQFGVYWPDSRKDAAIKDLKIYLNEHYQDIVKNLRAMYRF